MDFLYVQFANSMFLRHSKNDDYWDVFYGINQDFGYYRGKYVFEIPKWIAEINFLFNNKGNKVFWCINDIKEVIDYVNKNKFDVVLFSVMDCNTNFVKQIIEKLPNQKFFIGGYNNEIYEIGKKFKNVKVFDTIEEIANYCNINYKMGTDYSLFKGESVIPRLTMSHGCLNNCKFCIVPHHLKLVEEESIFQQIKSFDDLQYKLIYIDDKTFGQASNFILLKDLFTYTKKRNKDFNGFIIQTTCYEFLKKYQFFCESGVKVVEIGLETFNDFILKKYRKSSNEKLILESIKCARKVGLKLIFNIIIGFPEETEETYNKTIDFLKENRENIFGINLSIYTNYESKNSMGEIEFEKTEKLKLHEKYWDKINDLVKDIII